MSPALTKIPEYLKKYTTEQNYDRYTSLEHATWRYIMRQNQSFFKDHAAKIYLDGLKKTGISTDRIPRISEMDECLAQFGWGAVAVEGFIPPNAFLDFQARGILPIACDMRTLQHVAYTPAPDIVHEAAGHAPIIADPDYANYLHEYATLAQKAIFSKDDVRLYEAIRLLSDVKENPDKTPADIAAAEAKLEAVSQAISHISEAMKVARMNWWTVEYGLVGRLTDPRIYGAGLLSSIGESQSCLSDKVKKIPLTVACVETAYNITEPQPQLFVADDFNHLVTVLRDFERTLGYARGGYYGLSEAKLAETVTTTELDSSLQMTGVVADFHHRGEEILYLRFDGPMQLGCKNRVLPGQDAHRHATGFSTPLGRWQGADKATHLLTDTDLKHLGVETGKRVTIRYENGTELVGTPKSFLREGGKLLVITFSECKITREGKLLYDPAWGEMDLGLGEKVMSVAAGVHELLPNGQGMSAQATSKPGRTSPFTYEEKSLFSAYQSVRDLREGKSQEFERTAENLLTTYPKEWLLQLELYELKSKLTPKHSNELGASLQSLAQSQPALKKLIQDGVALAH